MDGGPAKEEAEQAEARARRKAQTNPRNPREVECIDGGRKSVSDSSSAKNNA